MTDDDATGYTMTLYDTDKNWDGKSRAAVMARVVFTAPSDTAAEAIMRSQGMAELLSSVPGMPERDPVRMWPQVRLGHCTQDEGHAFEEATAKARADGDLATGDPALMVVVVATHKIHVVSVPWKKLMDVPDRLS